MKIAVFLTTEDRFFASHRLPIARALRERGYSVHVAARETDAAGALADQGFTFHPLPLVRDSARPLTEVKTLLAVTRLYARLRPVIAHHSTIKANVYGSLAARALRIPAVVNTVTGLGFALMERPEEGLRARSRRQVAELLYAHALTGVTVFQNTDQMRYFVSRGWVDQSRTRLVRGAGVDLARFQASPLPDENLVLLPARLLWDKGIGEFVSAARALKGKARFVLAGGLDRDNRAAIDPETVARWVREGVIEWWGFRRDMPEVLRLASLVVLPSYAEGMPLALAEAQAAGRACITTDAPGCREAIVPGESGWLVPVRDEGALTRAIAELLADRERLRRMGAAGRRHAEAELGLEHIVAETLAACRLAGAPL